MYEQLIDALGQPTITTTVGDCTITDIADGEPDDTIIHIWRLGKRNHNIIVLEDAFDNAVIIPEGSNGYNYVNYYRDCLWIDHVRSIPDDSANIIAYTEVGDDTTIFMDVDDGDVIDMVREEYK